MLPSAPPLPLPPDVVLLHIGPHKTGTTSLQGAFHTCREQMSSHGVHYAGPGRQPMLAALSMTGRPGRKGDPAPTKHHWRDLVDEVSSVKRQRVIVSSEFFADADEVAARAIVDDLGGPRVHVVVTLRPLTRIMPSQWQQYVQNGLRMRYPDWLDNMLNQPPYDKPTPTFWHRHSHGKLVARWAGVVGPERLTVIVLDERDRGMLLHSFEDLTGLPRDTLVPEATKGNRSLTLGEVEVVRLLNEEFRRRKWNDDLYGLFVRTGVAKKMLAQRRPTPDEPAITTPRWAAERAAEIGREVAETIRGTGAHVLGDLDSLGEVPSSGIDDVPPPADPALPASAAAIALIGTIVASRRAQWPAKSGEAAPEPVPASVPLEEQPLADVDTKTLARVLAARVRRRTRIRFRARLR